MARNSVDGFERLVVWLLVFAFFGPVLAVQLADTIDQVLLTMAPYASVLVLAGLSVYVFRSRY